ncbi:terpene cyclase/mutase family protein [Candidatus Sumerlaeota bacterium]|nr:terpene cyclase/mutase family protein [Candidatus Sumerlaeota bacterium]
MRWIASTFSILVLFLLPLRLVSAQTEPQNSPDAAITRGLAFIAKDAMVWKTEHNCASCHHASLVVWAMREAKSRGHTVDEPVLAGMTQWLTDSGDGKTGVPRPPGIPKALNTKAVYFTLGLAADPQPSDAAREAIKRMSGTMKEDQTDNGSWAAWPNTRPPFFGPSDESMTLLVLLALQPAAAMGDEAAVAARDRGVRWLTETPTDNDPQSVALRLILWNQLNRPAADLEPLIKGIVERQNADGGWSQAKDMASDAWGTGQALYALSAAIDKSGDSGAVSAIVRGRDYLIRTQREDGSWPMTSRPIPPNGSATSLIPITCAGTAWGVLGLVGSESPPKAPAHPSN